MRKLFPVLLTAMFSFISVSSHAGVTLSGTRMVYDGKQKESSVTVNNPDKTPYLIQSWITDAGQEQAAPEFVITPPLFRLDGEKKNALRVVLTKDTLAQDRETLYWLNVKAIPASDPNAKDSLLISINSRIKLFYRPAGLNDSDAESAYKEVTFSVQGNQLTAKNPTPFYINLAEIKIGNKEIEGATIIAPFSTENWTLSGHAKSGTVTWKAINDFGGKTESKNVTL